MESELDIVSNREYAQYCARYDNILAIYLQYSMGTLKKSYMYIKVGLTHLFQLLFLNLLTYLLAQYVNSCNDR